MRLQRRSLFWLMLMTLSWLLCKPHTAHAYAPDLNKAAEPQASKYKSPEDLIDLIPVVNHVPRTFLWGRGYVMRLSGQTLRIDHRLQSKNPTVHRGDCTLGFSYVTPVAGFFTTRIDMPLFYSNSINMSEMSFNRMGDYVTSFSRGADTPSLRLVFSAKF